MPAVMEDPAGPTLFRVSGQAPFPDPSNPGLPADIVPRQVTLRDRQTVATIVPFASRRQLPSSLLAYLCDQLNREIDGGDTYPMMDALDVDSFADYWFQTFGAVMLLGSLEGAGDIVDGRDWARECLGSFFIKPNYPGRSSHVCNASFIVTDGSRNRGVGRLMGEAYLEWAPRLGYTYSVFNLVYETNVASCRIWDALGFKRIGRVRACGNLRSHPERLVDAIIYGRDLGPGDGSGGGNGDELVSEERFDKIRFYLKYGKYPNGADRAEKSRLRSAATHYKLLDGDKLMLKDKEVVADPVRQYEVARAVHAIHHGGINKTTATIAEKYHWSRIKETVSDVIRACVECKDLGKAPGSAAGAGAVGRKPASVPATTPTALSDGASADDGTAPASRDASLSPQQQQTDPAASMTAADGVLALQQTDALMPVLSQPSPAASPSPYANPSDITVLSTTSSHDLQSVVPQPSPESALHAHPQHQHHPDASAQRHGPMLQDQPAGHHHHHHHHHHHPSAGPAIPAHRSANPFDHYPPHADFQALLNATDDDDVDAAAAAAVDRDLEMLIEQDDMDDDGGGSIGHDAAAGADAMQGLDDDDDAHGAAPRTGKASRGLYDDDMGFDNPGH
ncbi:hypothetical protein HIM_03653 [Hirsutella minnesotensis 3608]|uniref:N-acetyltransferase domain-containing protein n=1 Tax=Hirsutella minnesotensis 3608 TaxID=1043627 RepID=A0A0F7ZLX9_9HYPO|nr:hypothetical protein HIM_03653 [Hirsutella minnesotensis 3608]